MAYKVYYSFLHDNIVPYEVDEYKIYRQEISGSNTGDFVQINAITPTGIKKNLIVSGVDSVPNTGVLYNYKVSAHNSNAEVFGINPVVTGVTFY